MEISNKAIGRNLQKFRMLRDMKAEDLAERIGMQEGNYTRYERGEAKITVDLIQKVATALDVDPISILATSPDKFIETISNNTIDSAASVMGNGNMEVQGDINAVDKKQQELVMKLIEKQHELTDKLIELIGKK